MQTLPVEFSVKRLVPFTGEGSLKAYVDLELTDLIVIKGLRVVKGKNGLFVSMPRQQGKDTKWYDMVSIENEAAKDEISRIVLKAYEEQANQEAYSSR